MTNSSTRYQTRALDWQAPKHLRSGDHFWILTDIQAFTESYYAWSPPQQFFRVGIFDLTTRRLGFAHFGRDIAYALLKAGFTSPPWTSPAPFSVSLTRRGHDGQAMGRYVTTATISPIDPSLTVFAYEARRRFWSQHVPNSWPGMWTDLKERADRETAIENVALGMIGLFSAGDIKKVVGLDVDVTPVLRRLVEEGRLLPPVGRKRGTRYEVAFPKLVEGAG